MPPIKACNHTATDSSCIDMTVFSTDICARIMTQLCRPTVLLRARHLSAADCHRFLLFEYLSLSVFVYYGVFSITITPNMPVPVSPMSLPPTALGVGSPACGMSSRFSVWLRFDWLDWLADY